LSAPKPPGVGAAEPTDPLKEMEKAFLERSRKVAKEVAPDRNLSDAEFQELMNTIRTLKEDRDVAAADAVFQKYLGISALEFMRAVFPE